MAILARETKKMRFGARHADRQSPDPIRVAEEYSMLDVIPARAASRWLRQKGCCPNLARQHNPADLMGVSGKRDWILAMTSHDGPFNWEGTHFITARSVWPRLWQQPTCRCGCRRQPRQRNGGSRAGTPSACYHRRVCAPAIF
jgi:hypothetical protein